MRCPRCGNENPGDNRFCGMCGASLLSAPVATPAPPQPVSVAAPKASAVEAAAAPAAAPEPRRAATAVSETPAAPASISGPSFLGLNEPAAGTRSARKRASLSIDPHSAAGSNLDYLLDEEDPHHHWGIGKILLVLIALGLAVGFGYLRFKNQGLAWISGLKKPAAAVAQNSTAPDSAAPTPPATTPRITPDTQPAAQPAAPQPAASAPTASSPTNSAPTAGTAPGNAPAATSPEVPASDTGNVGDKSKSNNSAPASVASDKPTAPAESDASAKDTSPDASAPASKPAEKPTPAPKAPAPKAATPKPSASKPATDAVAEARRYLYGRGAAQDCDRGLRLLKPEANRSNPKAMIEMGALYSAGLCAPRDLPTAYRWFALALRKDPENTSVQTDLSKLWGEMTQPERQLAIKMTQ